MAMTMSLLLRVRLAGMGGADEISGQTMKKTVFVGENAVEKAVRAWPL